MMLLIKKTKQNKQTKKKTQNDEYNSPLKVFRHEDKDAAQETRERNFNTIFVFTVLYWRPVVRVCCDHRP